MQDKAQRIERGDVVISGDGSLGIVVEVERRMTPPRYWSKDQFKVLFHPGQKPRDGAPGDGDGCRLATTEESADFRERLDAMAAHGDLGPRSVNAHGLMQIREIQLKRKPEPFPVPYVVKPTLFQLVTGARVEYEDSKGGVHLGWVGKFGVWKDLYDQDAPAAPRVSVESCQPGEAPMSMAMPPDVLVELVLRVTCLPDPSMKECWKCHQSGEPKGGEYPCEVCTRPTVHDDIQKPPGDMRRVSAEEAIAIYDAGHAATTVKGPEAYVHGGTYISKTDCNRWIAGTLHLKVTPGQEIYGPLQVSRDDASKITCPECLSA
jgi:hypothetical protein